jgi:HAD superfamily hydrolase (TIGR01509 family)
VSPVKAVLIDLYDTLVWTDWPVLRERIEERAAVSGRGLLDGFERTRVARSIGTYGSLEGDLAEVLKEAGLEHDDALVKELAETITNFLETGVHLWDDSLPALRELRARGFRTAVVSNCDHGTRPVVERLGLHEETDAVVLSFEAGVAKPDAGIYRQALEAVGAEPEEAVFVDDQLTYCEGAEAVGIRPFLIVRADRDGGIVDPPPETANANGGPEVIRDLRSLVDRF